MVLALVAGFACQPGSAQNDSWTDDELAKYLMRNGVAVNAGHASLWFDFGVLGPNQMDRFSKLANRGVVYIEAYLGASHEGSQKIQYFISDRVEISHSTARSVFLPIDKVRDRTAPRDCLRSRIWSVYGGKLESLVPHAKRYLRVRLEPAFQFDEIFN